MILEKENIRLCDGEIYSIKLKIEEDAHNFFCDFYKSKMSPPRFRFYEHDPFRHINETYDPVNHMKCFIKKANERIRLADRFKKEVSDWDGSYGNEE